MFNASWVRASVAARQAVNGVLVVITLVSLATAGYLGYTQWQLKGAAGGPPSKGGSMGGPGSGGLPVTLGTAKLTSFVEGSELLAIADARQSVEIRPQVMGTITQILVQQGQGVSKGQALLVIDNAQQQATALAAEAGVAQVTQQQAQAQQQLAQVQAALVRDQAALAFSKQQLSRYQSLSVTDTVTRNDLDRIQAETTQAQAQVQARQAEIKAVRAGLAALQAQARGVQSSANAQEVLLDRYTLRAPFAGVVGELPTKVGDYVAQNTVVATVTQAQELEIKVAVPASMAGQLGQVSRVAVLSATGEVLGQAPVFFKAERLDPESQTRLIKARWDNSRGQLTDDQQVRVKLVLSTQQALALPSYAVVRQGDERVVFVATPLPSKDPKAPPLFATERHTVMVGQRQGDTLAITQGLQPNDTVVLAGAQKLGVMPPGMPVMQLPPAPKG
jgi:RND family efflux transporter MFP subunit